MEKLDILPKCQHRGAKNEHGRYPCSSPKLIVQPEGVYECTCMVCPYSDEALSRPRPAVVKTPSGRLMPPQRTLPCIHLGEPTGETVDCPSCRGSVRVKTFACEVFRECTTVKLVPMLRCCKTCDRYEPIVDEPKMISGGQDPMPARSYSHAWAYGVTTVPEREDDLLPRTLASLKAAGFNEPWLFVDGADHADAGRFVHSFPDAKGVTCRYPTIQIHGNWVLSLYELYIRFPHADRYAVFQDDFVAYKNLRAYLDHCPFPSGDYWNLYSWPQNEKLAGFEGRPKRGWMLSNQCGRGAIALVFDRPSVLRLLTAQHMVERPMSERRGWMCVDGGVVDSFRKAGGREWIHVPSLVQHTGTYSTKNRREPKQLPSLLAETFRGEEFDALDLLPASDPVPLEVPT